ncbi:MAG TPA: hypothetical protein VIY96_00760, partial [Thermoanaerobaculia bacterium]
MKPPTEFRLRPLLWAAAYVLATTFSFAPTLSFRRAPASPGSIAPRDVVAPRDLIVLDATATARRRAEAAAEVPPVYDWDATASPRLEAQLRESFRKARAVLGPARHPSIGPVVRDAFDLPIGEEALAALGRLSFSDELENALVSTVSELYRGGVVDSRDQLLENRARGVLLRDPATAREIRRKDFGEVVEYGQQAKNAVAQHLASSGLTGRGLTEVAAFVAAALRPNMTYNAAETAKRREQASRSVETVLTRIPRGKVLVRKGDEVSPRAAEWIAAVRASVSDPSSWVKVAGILLLQLLAALAFWIDARRHRRRRRERGAEVVYGAILATGILFSLLTRGAFALAQNLSSSFEGSAWAAHMYYAIPFAAGAI